MMQRWSSWRGEGGGEESEKARSGSLKGWLLEINLKPQKCFCLTPTARAVALRGERDIAASRCLAPQRELA